MSKGEILRAVESLRAAREFYAAHGHNVSRVTIGHFNGQIRICDDNGAYDLAQGCHRWYAVSVGCCAMTIVDIVQLAIKSLNSPIDATR